MAAWTRATRAGDWTAAWAIEAAVLAGRDPATRDDPRLPYHQRWVWDGRAFAGCDVLVRCYHGLGDTIQFARFLPALAARASRVTLEAQPSLVPLLGGLGARIVPFDERRPLPPAERDIEITELPFALRQAPSVGDVPYLHATPAALPEGTIGLCHAAGGWDAARVMPEMLFERIVRRHPCVTLVPAASALPVRNPEGCSLDLGETAALASGAALVVTVDTMIAHLAGALGRPVWLMLKHAPDWRWDPEARSSAWYPNARLFVQPRPGDWGAVMGEVERALEEVPLAPLMPAGG